MHVAALHDGNKGRDLTRFDLLLADRALRASLLLGIHNRPTLVINECVHAVFQKVVHIVRHAVEFLGAHHKIDMRRGLQKRLTARLGHAAEVAKDQMWSSAPKLAQHAHLANRLLLGHVAHAAGVEQNHIRFGFIRDELISALSEHFRHLLGVALVHLATVGFNVDAGHLGGGEFAADRRWGQGQVRSSDAENPTLQHGLVSFRGTQLRSKINAQRIDGIRLPHPMCHAKGIVLVGRSIVSGKAFTP